MTTYLFVTDKDRRPDLVETGEDDTWSCSSTTQSGDTALVYVKGVGIMYEWRVIGDKRADHEYKYVCEVAPANKFEPPIPFKELVEHIGREQWPALRRNLNGFSSIRIPDGIAKQILLLRGR